MSSNLGPYLLGQAGPYLEPLRRLNSRVAVAFQPNREDMLAFKAACPNTAIVGRIYQDDSGVQSRILADPQAAARWVDSQITAHPAFGLLDYWYIENEVCQYWDQLPALNQFLCASIALANKHNYRRLCANFSNGQPDIPGWQLLYPAMRMARDGGHRWGVHQYGWPTLWQPDADWYIHRLEHEVIPTLPAEFDSLKFIVGEYGLDHLIYNQKGGWQASPGLTQEQYVADLVNISMYTSQNFGDRVDGYCLFGLGSNGDKGWNTYNIEPILQQLADATSAESAPVQPDPPVEVIPMSNDPRASNCRAYSLDSQGKVNGVELVYEERPTSKYRLMLVQLIEEAAAANNTTATCSVLNKDNIPVADTVYLAYPYWRAEDAEAHKKDPERLLQNKLVPGNPDNRHMILSTYNHNVIGPLALYVGDSAGNPISDIIGGLGLPDNRHVCFLATWKERSETVVTGPLPEDETATDAATLADKVRWWMEEYARQLEAGNTARASAILYSLINLDRGLLYRLENVLKGKP